MRPGLQHRLQTTSRVDWFAILIDLNRRGIPTSSLTGIIGVPKGTILGWKQGAEPNHADGERLVGLWLRMTEKPRTDVPMTACPVWLDR